jgi:hypothetical protein
MLRIQSELYCHILNKSQRGDSDSPLGESDSDPPLGDTDSDGANSAGEPRLSGRVRRLIAVA